MSKLKCNSLGYGFSLRRHAWQEDGICKRCGKTRNPMAGLKMFRPIKSLDKSPSTEVLCTLEGEGQ